MTTCSPKHADLVRSYGAKYVFDYKDERVIEKIHEVAPNLKHAFDTIGNLTSSTIASHAFCKGPRYLCTVRPGKANTENVAAGTIVSDVLVWTAFPKDHSYGEFKWPVRIVFYNNLSYFSITVGDTDIVSIPVVFERRLRAW